MVDCCSVHTANQSESRLKPTVSRSNVFWRSSEVCGRLQRRDSAFRVLEWSDLRRLRADGGATCRDTLHRLNPSTLFVAGFARVCQISACDWLIDNGVLVYHPWDLGFISNIFTSSLRFSLPLSLLRYSIRLLDLEFASWFLIVMALKRGVNRTRGGGGGGGSRSALVILLVFFCVFAPLVVFVGRGVWIDSSNGIICTLSRDLHSCYIAIEVIIYLIWFRWFCWNRRWSYIMEDEKDAAYYDELTRKGKGAARGFGLCFSLRGFVIVIYVDF